MREPTLQRLFHDMANPPQDRFALDNKALHATQVRTKCYQDFAKVYNDMNFIPHFAVDVSAWCDVQICVDQPPKQHAWTWVAETMGKIRTKMSIVMRRFTQSGDLENHLDDSARDMKFWSQFSFGDPVTFYIYMAWDHGRVVPAWNSSMLQKDMQIDIGLAEPESDDGPEPRRRRRGRSTPDQGNRERSWDELADNANALVKLAVSSAASTGLQTSRRLCTHTLSLMPSQRQWRQRR
jgi:hypothetical protein